MIGGIGGYGFKLERWGRRGEGCEGRETGGRRGREVSEGSGGVEWDGEERFKLPLDCNPYFSIWWVIGGFGTKANPSDLALA